MNTSTYRDLDAKKAIDVLTREIPDLRPAHYLLVREKVRHVIHQMAHLDLFPFLMEIHNADNEEEKSNCMWINTNFHSPRGHLANVFFLCCQDDTSFLGIITAKAVPSGYKDTTGITDDDLAQYIATVDPYHYGDSYLSVPLRYYKGMSSAPWLQAMCHTNNSGVFEKSFDRLLYFLSTSFDRSLDSKRLTFSAISVAYKVLGMESWFVVGYTDASSIKTGNKMWIASDQPLLDDCIIRRYILETQSTVCIRPVPDDFYSVMVLASPRQIMVRLDSDCEYTYAINPYMIGGWNLRELEQDSRASDLIIRATAESL